MSVSSVAVESLRWYLVVSAFGWLMYPLLYRTLIGLPSRGLALARPLGLLLAALGPWWLSATDLLPYSTTLVIAIPVVLAITSWGWELLRGDLWRFLAANRIQVLVYELLTLLLFIGYVVFRCYNPAIQHTEKPMELAFLSSLIHARSMPPADPWFLGKPINYYYLGYLLMALPARVARIAPSHAFNLALATLFATATTSAVAVASDLASCIHRSSRSLVVVSGALAGLFLVGIGNLVTPIDFIEHPIRTLHAGWWEGVGWNASRVIVDGPNQQTINEFPAFSFVIGDLHPHVLAYPLFISSLGVGLALAMSGKDRRALWPAAALAGALGASLYATNSWDMPPALILGGLGILIATSGLIWRSRILPLLLMAAAAIFTVLPFWANYTPAIGLQDDSVPSSIRQAPLLGRLVNTIGVVTWPRTSTSELLRVHGLYLAIAALFLLVVGLPVMRRRSISSKVVAGYAVALFVVSVVVRFPGFFWFVGPAAVFAVLAVITRPLAPRRYLIVLFAIAFFLLSITELVFLEDAFGDRMNTVFKLYFQVWALFAIAGAVALPIGIGWLRRHIGTATSWGVASLIGIVVLGAGLYPPISAYQWTSGFSHFSGLDGLAYMRQNAPAEMAAIDWLQTHASPSDHILEAPGCSYGENGAFPDNLFSMATGLQTPLGWQFHEYQWRLGDPTIANQLNQRRADVKAIYDAPSSPRARSLLDHYDIRFIVVGPIERNGYSAQCDGGAPYSPAGLEQIGELGWNDVFNNPAVTIYERP